MNAEANTSDEELMTRVQTGDVQAFEQLFRRYSKPLQNFFFRMLWDRDRSEDLLQEVFVKLWKASATYKSSGKFKPYLFTIARNHWLHDRDKISRRPREFSLEKKKTPNPSANGQTPRPVRLKTHSLPNSNPPSEMPWTCYLKN